MFVLIIGGAASGKSELAETICEKLGTTQKAYIATMAVYDVEGEKRVARHREMRKNKGFDTIEHILCNQLGENDLAGHDTALLECISNLLANEMYLGKQGAGAATEQICSYIDKLKSKIDHLVVVSNDIFGDGAEFDSFTSAYIKALAHINQRLGQEADIVIESVCGIPIFLKGEAI